MSPLFANHQCCYLNEYFTKTLKKPISNNDFAIMFQVRTRTIRRWIDNCPMDQKPLGRRAVLREEIEIELSRMLIQRGDESHGLTQNVFINFIKEQYERNLTRG